MKNKKEKGMGFMMKLNLIGSKEDRQYVMEQNNVGEIDLIDMLKKFGNVADYMTESMVTEFYGVDIEVIKKVGTRNKEELSKYGYRVYKRDEILNGQYVPLENIPNRGLRLYPIKAVILMGMMLTESVVAAKLRRDIMNKIFNPKDDLEQRMERMENTVFKFEKMMEQLIEMNKNLITVATRNMEAFKEAPKVEMPKVKARYTITPIAKPFGIKAANANKILAKNGIISKGDKGGWILNEKYEEAGWGITCDAGQHNGPFVRYTEKGKQATTKILSRSSNQEQLNLF